MTIAIHTPGAGDYEADSMDAQEEQMIQTLKSNDSESALALELDVEAIRNSFKAIFKQVSALASETKMSFIRQDSVNQLVEDNNSYSFYVTLAESLVFCGIAAAQVMYIRGMLESKRLI